MDKITPNVIGAVILLVIVGGTFIAGWSSKLPREREQTAVYDARLGGEWGRCRQCAIEDPDRDRRAACVTLLLFDKRRTE